MIDFALLSLYIYYPIVANNFENMRFMVNGIMTIRYE
jgi:hypothetical protein